MYHIRIKRIFAMFTVGILVMFVSCGRNSDVIRENGSKHENAISGEIFLLTRSWTTDIVDAR